MQNCLRGLSPPPNSRTILTRGAQPPLAITSALMCSLRGFFSFFYIQNMFPYCHALKCCIFQQSVKTTAHIALVVGSNIAWTLDTVPPWRSPAPKHAAAMQSIPMPTVRHGRRLGIARQTRATCIDSARKVVLADRLWLKNIIIPV